MAGDFEGALRAFRDTQRALLAEFEEQLIPEMVTIYRGQIDRISREVQLASGSTFELPQTDLAIVETLIEFDIDRVTQTIAQNVADARVIVARQVLLRDPVDVSEFEDATNDTVRRHIETELATSAQGFSNAVKVKQAVDLGLEHFRYAGPDIDKVTRPFCKHLQGQPQSGFDSKVVVPDARTSRVYTLDEIRQMRNGQGLDVFSFTGGFNCRHSWNGISEERARELGFPN